MMIRILLVALLTCCSIGSTALGEKKPASEKANEQEKQQLSEFEGVLKIHPKFLYKYFIDGVVDGQHFALFGEEKLKGIKLGSRIHVTGRLGTKFHSGGTEKNLSPFPRTWYVYMELESVTVLDEPK